MKIELLAPAGNIGIGRSAIAAGADAVYIGGPGFGARYAAANSLDDIAQLTRYAHDFGAKVYLTMNTILLNEELAPAARQSEQAWNAGVDALIVQDMAFLKMALPPIPLHASTQMFSFDLPKVQLLQRLGFERVVLERALTMAEITEIRRNTTVELEAFIHGAICVGYSGQCYLSHALCARGGNRGNCAQACRASYNLTTEKGEKIAQNENILSVGDMNLSDRIAQLIKAGACSLKIEGRLKDESYVVNNVAHYNNILNDLGVDRIAAGHSHATFKPNPLKSFSRPFTHYFFDSARARVGAASKSLGEFIGVVKGADKQGILIDTKEQLATGDGLCWLGAGGEVEGASVNRISGGRVQFNREVGLARGTEVFRNFDKGFRPSGRDVARTVAVKIEVTDAGLQAVDEEDFEVRVSWGEGLEAARNEAAAREALRGALSKSGGTIFEVAEVEISMSAVPHLGAARANGLRRELLEELLEARRAGYVRRERDRITRGEVAEVEALLASGGGDFRLNVSNDMAREVYEGLGIAVRELAAEVGGAEEMVGREVLRTRFCLRRERGLCPGVGRGAEPLILENNGQRLRAEFDCQTCQMRLIFLGRTQ